MITNLLDPFPASWVDLVSRNDGCDGGGYIYGGLYNITTCHDLMALYSVTHQLDFMLTTILPRHPPISHQKGALKLNHPSVPQARQVNWRLISAGIQLLDVPEGVREGGGDSDGASSSSSGSNISMSEGGSSESGVNIVVGLANSADCSWASSSG
jgi:hypothetical protein